MPHQRFSQAKLQICSSIHRFRLLASYQLLALHYAPTSKTTVERHCQELTEEGYTTFKLYDRRDSSLDQGGRKLRLYGLAPKGARKLRAEGLLPGEFRQVKDSRRDTLSHLVGANDALITAIKLAPVISYKTEVELRAASSPVIGDGWVQYQSGVCLHLEYNRGHEDETQIRDKVRRLVPYLRATDTRLLYLFPTKARYEQVADWAWKELGAQDAQELVRQTRIRFGTLAQCAENLRKLLQLQS